MKRWFLMSALTISLLQLRALDTKSALGTYKALAAGEIRDEVDPTDQRSCYSMGQISLTYVSGEIGPPNVGLRITDPRGRTIGYDPRADEAWQELPLAEGFVDCDENEDTRELRNCTGHVQICGPISGTYKVEILPAQDGKYSISVSGTSQVTRDGRVFTRPVHVPN